MIRVRSQALRSAFFALPVAPLAPAAISHSPRLAFPITREADPARSVPHGPLFAGMCRPWYVSVRPRGRSGNPAFSPSWVSSAVG